MQRVAEMYEEYFQMTLDAKFKQGFYQLHPERHELAWLGKIYPEGHRMLPSRAPINVQDTQTSKNDEEKIGKEDEKKITI